MLTIDRGARLKACQPRGRTCFGMRSVLGLFWARSELAAIGYESALRFAEAHASRFVLTSLARLPPAQGGRLTQARQLPPAKLALRTR